MWVTNVVALGGTQGWVLGKLQIHGEEDIFVHLSSPRTQRMTKMSPSIRSLHGHLWVQRRSLPSPGDCSHGGRWQDLAHAGLCCAIDLKFRNCSDLYFEKNPWGIKYLQKISSCVNNRKIQYSESGLVFNKFENFMILLLLFIAYFICRCLFSQAVWSWVFHQLVQSKRTNFLGCSHPCPASPLPPEPVLLVTPMGCSGSRHPGRVSSAAAWANWDIL